jgi:hypothetical protein
MRVRGRGARGGRRKGRGEVKGDTERRVGGKDGNGVAEDGSTDGA